MRTEEDGNENEGRFVSVGARVATLPRGWGGGVYVACFITAMWQKLLGCVVRFASALVLMSVASLPFYGKNCRAYFVRFVLVLGLM